MPVVRQSAPATSPPSVVYDGVVYDMTVVSGDTLYWGGENDCYQKLT